ncbi:hypothetical protein [Pendulispora brunnea]|uniref:hypothetical protein n=1 Tax=Pendulispora brunnea TaxID=2905690 RepID=UPI00374E139B
MTCEPITRKCVFTCDAGICPGTRTCNARNVCIECTSTAQCSSSGRVCETATGSCEQCTADSDCPAGRPRCDRTRGSCAQCISQNDCADGSVCDFRANTCFAIPQDEP